LGVFYGFINHQFFKKKYFTAILTANFKDFASLLDMTVFTARRNARIASAVLAKAIPTVCLSVCPSVRPSTFRLSHAGIVSKHYIKNVSGKVVAQSIAFRVVSIYWQAVPR